MPMQRSGLLYLRAISEIISQNNFQENSMRYSYYKINLICLMLAVSFTAAGTPALFAQADTVEPASASDEISAEKKSADGEEKTKPSGKSSSAFTLGEVVVRDWSIANTEDASTTTVVSGDDIEARNEKIISETLQMVPGMQIIQHRKGNRQFVMRGYGMESIALLVDGIPMTDAYGQNMDIDNISVLNVERIVVNRGTSSALYGTNGAAGSVNIITKKPEAQFGQVKAEYGQNGSRVFNMAMGAPQGKFYYWFTSTYDHSSGYDISERLDRAERVKWMTKLSGYKTADQGITLEDYISSNKALKAYLDGEFINEHTKYQISGKMGYAFTDKIEAGVNAGYSNTVKKNSAYRSGMISTYSDELGIWSPPLAGDIMANMTSHWPEYYNARVSPYASLDLGKLKVRAVSFFNQQSNTLEAFTDPYESARSWQQTEATAAWSIWTSRSYGINIYPSWKITDWNNLNAAVTYRVDSHDQHEQAQRTAVDIIALYGYDPYQTQYMASRTMTLAVEDEMNFLDEKLKISAGISYDSQQVTDYQLKSSTAGDTAMEDAYIASEDSLLWGTRDSINPVVSILGTPMKDFLILRAAASIKSKFPNLSTYAKIVPDSPGGKESIDNKISSERSYNASGGFEFILFNEALNLRADYFYSRYSDKIERIYNPDTEDWRYMNLEASYIQGAELTASGKLDRMGVLKEGSASLSYSLTMARNLSTLNNVDLNKGERFENTPTHKFTFDFRALFITDTALSIFGYYTMDQFVYVMNTIPDTNADFSTSYFKEMSLNNPLMINIKVTQNIPEGLELYVMCANLLDDYLADPLNPGPGRTFYFGGGAKF
jgi:outer membrane cobalamin receptor